MNPYTACATAAMVVLTLLPISRRKQWWIRALDFPRLQLFAMTAVLLVVELLMFDKGPWISWLVPAVAAGCLAYHGWWIIPYTVLAPFEVKQAALEDRGDILRVLVSNVLMSNRDSTTLIRLVKEHQPHVLVTLESDAWWQSQLDTLESVYPFAIKCPLDNRYGMHVYSRLPLEASAIEYLIQDDVPSMHTRIRLTPDTQVHAHFLHPAPPAPGENEESIERDAELTRIAHRVAHVAEPVIVTGDLNDVAWSRTTRRFRKLSRLLDPRVGRGMFNTFHAEHWFLRWPLDHLFHSDHFTVRSLRRLPAVGSDHFPLLTELMLTPQKRDQQQGLGSQADADGTAFR